MIFPFYPYSQREDKLLPLFSFRCDTLYFIATFYTHPYRANSHMLAYQLSVCPMGIVSQRYLPCLYCMQGCNLKVHYKISTLRFAEVVFVVKPCIHSHATCWSDIISIKPESKWNATGGKVTNLKLGIYGKLCNQHFHARTENKQTSTNRGFLGWHFQRIYQSIWW